MPALSKAFNLNPFSPPADAKVDFRARVVPRLYTKSIATTEEEVRAYWTSFWTVFDCSYDVQHLILHEDVAKALLSHPGNIANLVRVTYERAREIVYDAEISSSSRDVNGSGSGLRSAAASLFSRKTTATGSNATGQLLNCIRILSRIMPFILAQDGSALENDLFWSSYTPRRVDRKEEKGGMAQEMDHFVIGDEDDDTSRMSLAPSLAATNQSSSDLQGESQRCLAHHLMTLTVDMLFLPGFTVPAWQSDANSGNKGVTYTVWENGIGSTSSTPALPETDNHRCEVLRLLLVLLSKTLYTPFGAFQATEDVGIETQYNRWHDLLVGQTDKGDRKSRRITLSLLCSLLNTALKSGAHLALNGAGVFNAVGGAVGESYEKLISGGKRKEDPPRLALVKLCTQVLDALLVTPDPELLSNMQRERQRQGACETPEVARFLGSPPLTPDPSDEQANLTQSVSRALQAPAVVEGNVFRAYLAKLHRPSDLSFLSENILAIIAQTVAGPLLKLPLEVIGLSSARSQQYATDTLVLIWKLLEVNPRFAARLVSEQRSVHQLMVALLVLCLDNKEDETALGLVKLAAFVLQTISAERAFGSNLNCALHPDCALPAKYAVQGTAADLLIQSLYTLILTSGGRLNAIYPAFVLTITNISPYLKGPSIRTSTRLVQLFLAMSTPRFLLSDEANPRLVYYLLEAFNNVLQYRLSDCPHLIYALVRSHQRFEDLAQFTLAAGVTAIRLANKQRASSGGNRPPLSTMNSGLSSPAKTPRRMSLASERGFSWFTGAPSTTSERESEKAGLVAEDAARSEEATDPRTPAATTPSSPPVAPPSAEYPPPPPRRSEKAAGKQPARSFSQLTQHSNASFVNSELSLGEDADKPFVSKSGFQPTENWVASWREGLPIDAILVLISECLPKVSSLSSLSTNTAAIEYLRSVTLVGLLPPSPPLRPRPFVHSLHSVIWLTTVTWGSIYVQSLTTHPFWKDTSVRLFFVERHEVSGLRSALAGLMLGQGRP